MEEYGVLATSFNPALNKKEGMGKKTPTMTRVGSVLCEFSRR